MKANSFTIKRKEILNAGKINHKIYGTFDVRQKNEKSKLSVKFFVVDDIQLVDWAEYRRMAHTPLFVDPAKGNYTGPQEYHYSSNEAIPSGSFEIKEHEGNILYFVIDNGFSKITSKNVQLTVWEEWEESILPIDVVTTTPPEDRSIDETIRNLIVSAKKELRIISPYVDMHLVKEIREQHEQGVKIFMITRGIDEKSQSRENKQALTYIQEKLKENHKVNPYIHSRIIIRDEMDGLVSSADLTEGSLKSHYNAGIILADPVLVQKLLNYFNQAFLDSKLMNS